MKSILPPVCLFLSLSLAITGFAIIAFGGPEESISLHEARASGDELSTNTLEDDLAQRQRSRRLLLTLMFVGSGAMTLAAFGAMGGRK